MEDDAQGSHRFEIYSITRGLMNIQSVSCVAIKHVYVNRSIELRALERSLTMSVLHVAFGIQS